MATLDLTALEQQAATSAALIKSLEEQKTFLEKRVATLEAELNASPNQTSIDKVTKVLKEA